jgi:hypothetical protein
VMGCWGVGFDSCTCLTLHVGLGVILSGAQRIEVSVVLEVECWNVGSNFRSMQNSC